MNYIDYVIVILIVIAAVRGVVKGLVYEVASLIALIGGVWGAIKFSYATETFIVERLNFENDYIDVIAFLVTLVLIIVVVHLVAKAIEKVLKSVALGGLNRLLGAVFGVCKALFILGILLIVAEKLDESFPVIPEDHIEESRFYEPLRNVAVNTFPFVQGFYDDIKDKSGKGDKSQKADRKRDGKRRSKE